MKHSREQVDVYAETQVLDPQQAPVPSNDDSLALYEEYAREVAGDAAMQGPGRNAARRTR